MNKTQFLHPGPYTKKSQDSVLERLSQSLGFGCHHLCDVTQISFLPWIWFLISKMSGLKQVSASQGVPRTLRIALDCKEVFTKRGGGCQGWMDRVLVLSSWFRKSNGAFICWDTGCIDIPCNIVWGGGEEGRKKLKTRQVSSALTYLNSNLVHWDSFETLGSIYKAV